MIEKKSLSEDTTSLIEIKETRSGVTADVTREAGDARLSCFSCLTQTFVIHSGLRIFHFIGRAKQRVSQIIILISGTQSLRESV